ncbi:DMT family transporter [Kitasatospora purpeofusca]|uniref:DMT family transporter n=1 Tax=Kitasatospora purpeofusca TaxID=67352 RepID=UPI0035D6FEFD
MAVFLLALSAACFLGLGFVLQQHAAQRAPRADLLHWRLLLDLLRMPEWLLGTGFMVIGLILSALALNQGEVSLVEPLLATNLIFAMALARVLTRQTLGRSGWAGVVLLALGVTVFIVAGRPTGGGPPASELRHWLVIGTVVGLTLLLVSFARRLPLFEEATLLALAAGLLYGLQDALTRTTTQRLDHQGLDAVLRSWQPYAVVAAGVVGLLLVQSAFEAAPLRMSLPALTAAQPISGIVCAVGFLGDRLRVTPGALAWEVIGLIAVVIGVVVIGRHPALPGTTGPSGSTGAGGSGGTGGSSDTDGTDSGPEPPGPSDRPPRASTEEDTPGTGTGGPTDTG